MKYLVHRKTKEHKVLHRHTEYATCDWHIVEADSEGWIAHTGTECPLPGDAHCMYRMRSGKIAKTRRTVGELDWSTTAAPYDITHYRPVLEPEKVQEPDPAANLTANTVDLLDRLKVAHEHAQQIPDLEAELRKELDSMGYDLVARSPFVEPDEISKRVTEYHNEFNALCSQVKDPQAEAETWHSRPAKGEK